MQNISNNSKYQQMQLLNGDMSWTLLSSNGTCRGGRRTLVQWLQPAKLGEPHSQTHLRPIAVSGLYREEEKTLSKSYKNMAVEGIAFPGFHQEKPWLCMNVWDSTRRMLIESEHFFQPNMFCSTKQVTGPAQQSILFKQPKSLVLTLF